MLNDLKKKRTDAIEKNLVEELRYKPALADKLAESMEYSMTAGGKRLRPLLLMAAADAVGGDGDKYITTACALEFIHTYSLIHDDLPAMDNDDYRRGKLTNHKVFGDGIAILAGDALLTMAFELISRQKDVAADVIVSVLSEISQAAGAAGMVGGQVLDLEAEDRRISLDELKTLHMGKTGALFKAAIRSGAILAGADKKQLSALTDYAEMFGLAFQITDDILDVTGDENVIGKPVGSDERNNKSTYVTLTSLERAKELAIDAVNNGINALSEFDDKADFLRDTLKQLIERNK